MSLHIMHHRENVRIDIRNLNYGDSTHAEGGGTSLAIRAA